MPASPNATDGDFIHRNLDSGVEFAAEPLPQRDTVSIYFRMLTGVVDDPPELTGVGSLIERTLSKGTQRYDGRGLADAFDAPPDDGMAQASAAQQGKPAVTQRLKDLGYL